MTSSLRTSIDITSFPLDVCTVESLPILIKNELLLTHLLHTTKLGDIARAPGAL